jgi:hypothetical protein
MSVFSAKVFKAGNSQAGRLPSSLKIKAKAFVVTEMNGGLFLADPVELARRDRALKKLLSLPPLGHELERP